MIPKYRAPEAKIPIIDPTPMEEVEIREVIVKTTQGDASVTCEPGDDLHLGEDEINATVRRADAVTDIRIFLKNVISVAIRTRTIQRPKRH